MRRKVCCIFNLAPHYRAPIYRLMDQELNCDFYFGDTVGGSIKTMNVEELEGYQKTLRRKVITRWKYYWLSGSLRPIFGSYKYYIISGGFKYLNLVLLIFVSKFTNKKVIAWGHGLKGNETGLGAVLMKKFYSYCDFVLLYGDRSKEIMVKKGIKKKKLIPLYNSLDYDTQLTIRKTITKNNIYNEYFGNDFPVIIHIGRIQQYKRLDKLLDLLDRLKKKGNNCNLVFVGKDVDGANLEAKAEKLGIANHVWFYGPCYEEGKNAELLYNASVCVSPGPIGLTAIHAATYGTPIVTNDNLKTHGPEHEIIHEGINGSFFELGDSQDFYEKVKYWLYTSQEVREKCKEYSWKIIDKKYNPHAQVKIIKKIIS